MTFSNETDFEKALINLLVSECGWEKEVLEYKNEKDLLNNWAGILFENNRQQDRLNDYPLTDGEMQQIIDQIVKLRTPLNINGFINGRSVSIKRENPDDKEHFGKEVSLKIYDRQEIAAGQSRYQIARQPVFAAKSNILPNRRGDFMLLINGMPLFHVELKKSNIPISQAYNQIEKYSHEGVFTGLFSLVQIFVAMNPEEAVYFANPGIDGRFNKDFYFHWADFNNEPINDWKQLASCFLSIPMAHQLIGFYTVADGSDGILKVMRSYQYYAANKISDTVAKNKWENGNQRGGYVWHTTGSGKTMTSFKSAQLIANSHDADKVVFLIDRIELGTQSAREYRGFAEETDSIQETEDTVALISKLKSNDSLNTLIVTSIQKMSNIRTEVDGGLKQSDIDAITNKRVVFIVDECHRDTFGKMMTDIKESFPKALFFGFTGTPIQLENVKKGCTTSDVFGNELHRYSIADGIRDKNVLGFDPNKVLTFNEKEEREAIALEKAKVSSVAEVFGDKKKEEIYYYYMNDVPMAGEKTSDGWKKGIEDYLLESGQYRTEQHQKMVVKDIITNWVSISRNYKFHGLLATSSIPEAIQYYHLFKEDAPELKVTALFDPSSDNDGSDIEKEDALGEIISDYNVRYRQSFGISTYDKMKKDMQFRLAHKKPYERIEFCRDEQIDLLIVVDQMLTGYDSKWLNVLHLDKILKYENIIQAFSRTNRLFNKDEKPFGTIKYYRAPYTMEKNIEEAVKLYSGDRPFGMFAIKLDKNLEQMNSVFDEIKSLFEYAEVADFDHLPADASTCGKFAKLFRDLNYYLAAAKVQGFTWKKLQYEFFDEKTEVTNNIILSFDERVYSILLLRYQELFGDGEGDGDGDCPYDLDGYLTTIKLDNIDAEYMNSRFEKYKKVLFSGNQKEIETVKTELHKSFASLSQEEQKYANIFLRDLETGDVKTEDNKTLRDYINEYMENAKNDQIHRCAIAFGLNEDQLREMMSLRIDEANIDEFGKFTALKETVDYSKASEFLKKASDEELSKPKVKIRVDAFLRRFIISGGFDIENV